MSGKSKVVHYCEYYRPGYWSNTACWHATPEKATDRWADVTCKKCLQAKKRKEQQ